MTNTTFYYEMDERAGLAENAETGEPKKAYISVDMPIEGEITTEEYELFHTKEVIVLLQEQLDVPTEYFKPISEEYYNEMTEE